MPSNIHPAKPIVTPASYKGGNGDWNFAKNNIPIVFYFNGSHADYHRVSDEVDKIDFQALTLRTQSIFYTAWEVANREDRLKVDVKKK